MTQIRGHLRSSPFSPIPTTVLYETREGTNVQVTIQPAGKKKNGQTLSPRLCPSSHSVCMFRVCLITQNTHGDCELITVGHGGTGTATTACTSILAAVHLYCLNDPRVVKQRIETCRKLRASRKTPSHTAEKLTKTNKIVEERERREGKARGLCTTPWMSAPATSPCPHVARIVIGSETRRCKKNAATAN